MIDRASLEAIDEYVGDHADEMIAFRRELHMHPETSWEEHDTTDRLVQRLRVAGLEPRVLTTGTGVICDIGNGDGPVVAVRGDMDALAMDDEKDVPYRSQVAGVAHACGHDVHTTVALGVGLAWARHCTEIGRLRLLFEPAEERVPGGAVQMIEEGALDDVSHVLGVHCDPSLDAGSVALRRGAISSAADSVEIDLRGPGGHTARPGDTVDLVAVAGALAHELPRRIAEGAEPEGELLCVFGSIRAGDAANVIPTHARLTGSVRTPDRDVWRRAETIVRDALNSCLAATGAEASCVYRHGVPPVVNHDDTTDLVAETARYLLGDDHVAVAARSLGGDTFAWYTEQVPGCFVRLGVGDPTGSSPRVDLHSGAFDVDESAIAVAVRLVAAAATALHAR